MDSNPPRKKMMAAAGVLNLDDLPDSILEKVLTHLPFRDAAKTSILSKKWKEHWRNIPSLLFDNSLQSSDSVQEQLHYLLDMSQVLLHHRGSIHKFTLSLDLEEQYHPRIDNVMLFLRDKDVHELTFSVLPLDAFLACPHKIPSCLFSYQQLRLLDLANCEFKPPASFEGFPHLISLIFSCVTFSERDPLNFISKCPLLENLSIYECSFCGPFNIDAPRLKFFYIYGTLGYYLFFNNTPLLSSVDIYNLKEFGSADGLDLDELVATKLIRLFECLPVVEDLCISEAVELMPREEEQLLTSPRLPITISHLKVLELGADFSPDYESGVLLLLALIISFPNLQKLKITPHFRKSKKGLVPMTDLFKREDLSDVSFQNLQELEMFFDGSSMEVEFVKFMVPKSVVLKTVTLYYRRKPERDVSGAVAKLASASPKVKINLVKEVGTRRPYPYP